MSKFGENGQIIFSPKDSKNYFSQVYGHKIGQKCQKWRKFGQNGQNWVILGAKMTS